MMRYKKITGIYVVVYILFSLILIYSMLQDRNEQNNYYRVEINRISNSIAGYIDNNENISEEDIRQYINTVTDNMKNITVVKYLPYYKTENQLSENIDDKIEEFYEPANSRHMEINIIKNSEGKIIGYVRYDYQLINDNKETIRNVIFIIGVVFILSICLIAYIYIKMILPFNRLSSMPYELAKGNLRDNIKENKERYFGKFVWGIGMLKDSIESYKNKELRLQKDKKLLLLSISHDIKTPLNAINLYAKSVEEGIYTSDKEINDAMKMIEKNTSEIDAFVKEIMKSSTEEVVSIDVKDSEYYLKDLIKKVEDGYTDKCGIRKTEFIVDKYQNILLKGDMDRMYEAIGNLIENAFKYGDGKKIEISFEREEEYILIGVYNSGVPISNNEISHIFDSFFRGSNTKDKSGNGLGLYICSEIMHKMQGDIYAESCEDGMKVVLVCRIS